MTRIAGARRSVDDVLAEVLRPGQDILIGQGQGLPLGLVRRLAGHRDRLRGSRLLVGLLLEDLPDLPSTEIVTFYPSGRLATEPGLRAGNARYLRKSLYELSAGLASGAHPVDVVLAQASPARNGRHSLGSTVDLTSPAIDRCDVAVLEVSADVPWTGPRSTIAAGSNRLVVHAEAEPFRSGPAAPGRPSELAARVVDWIPDGSTLELGIGRWSEELTTLLTTRRDLRIHTGALGDWVARLAGAGALRRGAPLVATDLGGTRDFYDALGDLPGVDLAPAYLTHDPDGLRRLPRFRAVNSVFEVDLLGRANCEVGPAGRRAGRAGLADFARGAAANDDGLSILVLSAESRARSRIVPELPVERVSLESDLIDVVVTEFASADLRGLDPAERRRALIACAHPRHRTWLERAALRPAPASVGS